MKRKFTESKKARRLNFMYVGGVRQMPVFWRRVLGIYGADHLSFDRKHPRLEDAVEGMRQRIAQAHSAARHQ